MATTEPELRSLLAHAHAALTDSVYSSGHGPDQAFQFLAEAPTDLCVRIADAWGRAKASGVIDEHFSAEEHSLLEMVAGVYTTTPVCCRAVDQLLGEIAAEAA